MCVLSLPSPAHQLTVAVARSSGDVGRVRRREDGRWAALDGRRHGPALVDDRRPSLDRHPSTARAELPNLAHAVRVPARGDSPTDVTGLLDDRAERIVGVGKTVTTHGRYALVPLPEGINTVISRQAIADVRREGECGVISDDDEPARRPCVLVALDVSLQGLQRLPRRRAGAPTRSRRRR